MDQRVAHEVARVLEEILDFDWRAVDDQAELRLQPDRGQCRRIGARRIGTVLSPAPRPALLSAANAHHSPGAPRGTNVAKPRSRCRWSSLNPALLPNGRAHNAGTTRVATV